MNVEFTIHFSGALNTILLTKFHPARSEEPPRGITMCYWWIPLVSGDSIFHGAQCNPNLHSTDPWEGNHRNLLVVSTPPKEKGYSALYPIGEKLPV